MDSTIPLQTNIESESGFGIRNRIFNNKTAPNVTTVMLIVAHPSILGSTCAVDYHYTTNWVLRFRCWRHRSRYHIAGWILCLSCQWPWYTREWHYLVPSKHQKKTHMIYVIQYLNSSLLFYIPWCDSVSPNNPKKKNTSNIIKIYLINVFVRIIFVYKVQKHT